MINANADTAHQWVKTTGTNFPIIADPACVITRAYGAECAADTTLVAPGGTIAKPHPGYGAKMLRELSAGVARTAGVAAQPLALDKAPQQLVVGCPISPMEMPLAAQAR